MDVREFRSANERARRLRSAIPQAISARFDRRNRRIVVDLSPNVALTFSPDHVQGLGTAAPAQLSTIEISPSGFGLYFPKLDADIYIPGLLEGCLGSRRWMAAQLGRSGGQSRSSAKKKASRTNGALGGRPRRTANR
jgi:hypothetical protein